MAVGTVLMAVVGVVMNALVMIRFIPTLCLSIPLSKQEQLSIRQSAAYGHWLFLCRTFNLVKGTLTSVITAVIYKRISVLIHGASHGTSGSYGVKKAV